MYPCATSFDDIPPSPPLPALFLPLPSHRRDFFPDVPKMKSQLEWMQAVKSGDPARIRQAQLNIAHRRAGLRTPSGAGAGAGATPMGQHQLGDTPCGRPGTSGWSTPGTNLRVSMHTPAMTPLAHAPDATPSGVAAPLSSAAPFSSEASAQLRAPAMGLDNYLAQHTSEDNASFSKVVGEEQQKKRLKVRALKSFFMSTLLLFPSTLLFSTRSRNCTLLIPLLSHTLPFSVCTSPGRQEPAHAHAADQWPQPD